MIDKIMRCDYNFNDAKWKELSKEDKDFIQCPLHKEPDVHLDARKLKSIYGSRIQDVVTVFFGPREAP